MNEQHSKKQSWKDPLNKPRPVLILTKTQETSSIYTMEFQVDGIVARPGQFFLVWVPGVDEIPMSISFIDNESGKYAISVARVGDATEKLTMLHDGEFFAIRGPFGNGYEEPEDDARVCFIGGGVGMASLNPLIRKLVEAELHGPKGRAGLERFSIINAARSKNQLLFHQYFKQVMEDRYHVSTDDGSCGEKCMGHELFKKILESDDERPDVVYTCGPELMMVEIAKACRRMKIKLQASLERMMRCGNGLCGLCGLDDDGLLVCKDGPVFTGEQLSRITEFGKYHRDFSGFKRDF